MGHGSSKTLVAWATVNSDVNSLRSY